MGAHVDGCRGAHVIIEKYIANRLLGRVAFELLFQRSQSKGHFLSVVFRLNAKLELDQQERHLVNRYSLDSSILIQVDQPGLFRKSFLLACLSFVILNPVVAFYLGREIGLGRIGVVSVAFAIAVFLGFVFYHQLRETIYVKDLIYGRDFKCNSVCELARKEAYLQTITGYLRQVMESAKNWDGVEHITIEPLPKEEARRAILSGPLF